MPVSGPIRQRVLLRALAGIALALGAWAVAIVHPAQAAESHAIAMHGAPALPSDFPHMPYANPDARRVDGWPGGCLEPSTASIR